MESPVNAEADPSGLLPAPGEPRRLPWLHGLVWLQRGFRMYTVQPVRWAAVLFLWLTLTLALPGALTWMLRQLSDALLAGARPVGLDSALGQPLTLLPFLVPLVMVLLFPVVFAGLMVGCQAVARGQRLEPAHLLAGFRHEPSRLVTVGGINTVGQIVIGWMLRDLFGDFDFARFDGPDPVSAATDLMLRLQDGSGLLFGITVLQTLLIAALWFAPPLLAFHRIGALEAVILSFRASMRNMGALTVYGLGTMILLVFVMGLSGSVGPGGILVGLIALLVLAATLTTVIGSIHASYCDIFGVGADQGLPARPQPPQA